MRSTGLRKPSNMVPRRALNVALHALQRERCLFRSWMTILPFPLWPLAEHAMFGQNGFDASLGSVFVCINDSMPMGAYFFKSSFPFHRLVVSYRTMHSHIKWWLRVKNHNNYD